MIRRTLVLLALAAPALAQAAPPIVAWHYTVHRGDTLAAIAARMGVSEEALASANPVDADAPLKPGTVLDRPDPAKIAKTAKHGAKPARAVIAHAAPGTPPEPRPTRLALPGTPHCRWPTAGALVTRFGEEARGRRSNGIDLAAFAGMKVHAAAAGRVIFAGTEPERFGQLIVIDHGDGWASAYAYLGKVSVREGARVSAGAVIATIGHSGEAKKPTLHFELRKDNVPQDPLTALPPRL